MGKFPVKTAKNKQAIIEFTRWFRLAKGVGPTAREIARAIGLSENTYGTVSLYVRELIAEGFLERTDGMVRSLKVVGTPPKEHYYYAGATDGMLNLESFL